MRLINLMTFVCFLLLLAMVPAALQMAHLCGFHPPVALGSVVVLLLCAGMLSYRT